MKRKNETRKIGLVTVIKWVAIVFFIFWGFVLLISGNIGFPWLFSWFIALIWLPYFDKFMKNKLNIELSRNLKVAVTIILLILVFVLLRTPKYSGQASISGDEGCSNVYTPVCGSNGLTYQNECTAFENKVSVDYLGECKKAIIRQERCLDDFNPVCGSDGITYWNFCKAMKYGAEISHEGSCGTQNNPEEVIESISNEPLTYQPVTNFDECYEKFRVQFSSADLNTKNTIVECREDARKEILNIKNEKEGTITPQKRDFLEVKEWVYEAKDSYLNYVYLEITQLYPVYGDLNWMTGEEYRKVLDAYKTILPKLEMSLYYLYKIKISHPDYWDDYLKGSFEGIAQNYKNANQDVNYIYDKLGGYKKKYYEQVDPTNPIVVDIVNDETRGMTDYREIENILIQYVRDNINYTYDPNWQTDWVQPPAFTLLYGYGDCDDVTVLIASLFLRAGIPDVRVCFVTNMPHITVATMESDGLYIWEGTCNNCIGGIPASKSNMALDCKRL